MPINLFRSEDKMKFICDHMLIRVGKWLRAAGYDTKIVTTSISDQEVLNLALSENRLLMTRDRHFSKIKAALPLLIYLKSNELTSLIHEINQQIDLNWLYAPFSRCLNCNTLLEHPTNSLLVEQIPSHLSKQITIFWYCPSCQQFYWEGSHTRRMRIQLERWQKEARLLH